MLGCPHPAALAALAERTSPQVGKLGRRQGEPFRGRGVRRWEGCRLLAVGPGTQPRKTWATTCCVPRAFIPLYMGSVKPLQVLLASPLVGRSTPREARGREGKLRP